MNMLRLTNKCSKNIFMNLRWVSIQKFKCWNCEEAHDHHGIFCKKCNHIQPVRPDADFFSYFGLKRRYVLDDESLKKNFRKLQTHVHPDKFGLKTDKEKVLSEQHSSYLNQAYKTLNNPRDRARYLLRLLTEENTDETTTPDFAAEMFEFIEELEAEENIKKLEQKQEHIDNEVEQLLIQIENSFEKEETEKAKELLTRLRYFDRAKKILDKKLGAQE